VNERPFWRDFFSLRNPAAPVLAGVAAGAGIFLWLFAQYWFLTTFGVESVFLMLIGELGAVLAGAFVFIEVRKRA